jgi:hypothetical protein
MTSHLTSFGSSPPYREPVCEGCPEKGGGIVGIDASVEGFREFRADCLGEKSDTSAMATMAVDYESQGFRNGSTFRRVIKVGCESKSAAQVPRWWVETKSSSVSSKEEYNDYSNEQIS